MQNAARPLRKTNNLPLGEGLAERFIFVLLFCFAFSFQIFWNNNYLSAKQT